MTDETAARMGTMTRPRPTYCTARTTLTRTVVVNPEGGKYAPLPDPATREEVIRCEANRSDEHSCIGPVEGHGHRHMCRCGWTWGGYVTTA